MTVCSVQISHWFSCSVQISHWFPLVAAGQERPGSEIEGRLEPNGNDVVQKGDDIVWHTN